jgi:hypothetical protein
MEILYETEIIGARSRELMQFLWICIDDGMSFLVSYLE